jgi:hypothetical protein
MPHPRYLEWWLHTYKYDVEAILKLTKQIPRLYCRTHRDRFKSSADTLPDFPIYLVSSLLRTYTVYGHSAVVKGVHEGSRPSPATSSR